MSRATDQDKVFARYNWLTATEAARQLGDVDSQQVLVWFDAGLLTGFDASKDGARRRDIRFRQVWVDEFLERRTRKADAA